MWTLKSPQAVIIQVIRGLDTLTSWLLGARGEKSNHFNLIQAHFFITTIIVISIVVILIFDCNH